MKISWMLVVHHMDEFLYTTTVQHCVQDFFTLDVVDWACVDHVYVHYLMTYTTAY